jgi:hypothetical protein
MWKSRVVCEISKGWWKEWESRFCFSTLSTGPAFPQPSPVLIVGPLLVEGNRLLVMYWYF